MLMMRAGSSLFFLVFSLLSGVISINTAFAEDYISPELIRVSTPLYKVSTNSFKPLLGRYTYSVGWEGIDAASATVDVDSIDGQLHVTASARTFSGIDLFYKLRYTADAILDPMQFSPVSLHIDHQENSKKRLIDIRYNSDGSVKAVRAQQNGSLDKVLAFTPQNSMLEPISAAFMARGVDWHVGATRSFDVFNGKSRYLITLTATDRKTIEHSGRERDVFVISPKVRTLTTTKANEKLREASIYLSADEARDVLRIESSVFIGSVTTELVSFNPADVSESNEVRMARLRQSSINPSITR